MTVEPVSTLANRINSAILDWSYIGISFTVGHSTSRRGVWETDGSSTVAPRNDSHRWRALRRPGRVHLRSPRQRLRVDVLTDVCQLAVPDRNGENEVVLKRLVRGFDLPLGKADGQNPVSLCHIYGTRMTVCTELPTGRKLDEAFLKQYAGGDEITARQTYGDIFSFKPEGKLWISANDVPEIRAGDEAMWRRIKPIPFSRKIRGVDVDNKLEDKFKAEYSGILNWMLRGAKNFSAKGLGDCAAITELENKLRKDADSVLAWLSECCIKQENKHIQASVAYTSYTNFMRTSRRKPLSMMGFRASLIDKGFHHKKSSQCNYFKGIRLQE